MSTHGPIETKHDEAMNGIASVLDKVFNGDKKGEDREVGFALLIFSFGEGGFLNYISNAQRKDMLATMKEFIARAEGRHIEETQTATPGEQ